MKNFEIQCVAHFESINMNTTVFTMSLVSLACKLQD